MHLEEQLRIVKNRTYDKLSEGELTWNDYKSCVETYLKGVGLVQGDCESGENYSVVFKVATKLIPRLGAEESKGVRHEYVSLKKKMLSKPALDDVSLLTRLCEDTREYLGRHLGFKQITNMDFYDLIKAHLSEKYNLEDKLDVTASFVSGRFQIEFNVGRDPEKHDPHKHYLALLEETIQKI